MGKEVLNLNDAGDLIYLNQLIDQLIDLNKIKIVKKEQGIL